MTLPLCCFGNILWYTLYLRDDSVVIENHENYLKQTYRNRYEILGPNGKLPLSLPIKGIGIEKVPYSEVKMDGSSWEQIHIRSLNTAYNSSPFFEHYKDDLFALFENHQNRLFEFNLAAHRLICTWLGEPKESVFTSRFEKQPENDWRAKFKPSKQSFDHEGYDQVFSEKMAFTPNLSVLDVIFNLGPESRIYLRSLAS